MSDAYRTPGQQAEPPSPPPPRVCYDCVHARDGAKDGHVSKHDAREVTRRYRILVMCASGEVRIKRPPVVCHVSGLTEPPLPPVKRVRCEDKNIEGECQEFQAYSGMRARPWPILPVGLGLVVFTSIILWLF